MTDPMTTVQGHCPACRGASLFLGDGGHVTCSRLDCPDPTAADDLLHGERAATTGPLVPPALMDAINRADRAHEKTIRALAALHHSAETDVTRVIELAQRWRQQPDRQDAYRELAAALGYEQPAAATDAQGAPSSTGYCPACGRGDAAPTADDWEQQRQRADQAEAKVADYENRITWHTTCEACARILDSAIKETERRERAEAALARVRKASRRISSALIAVEPRLTQPYPDNPRWTPWTRFVGPALKELHAALQPPAPVDEPSPAEEARADRAYWTAKYSGEGQ